MVVLTSECPMSSCTVRSAGVVSGILATHNFAVERTSARSSTVYSDGLRGWPKPLALKR